MLRSRAAGLWTSLLFLLVAALPAGALDAQATGRVSGVVSASESGVPLDGVTVRLGPGARATLSDAAGRFEFRALPAGEYRVTVALIGYEDESRTVQISRGESAQIQISLPTAAIRLDAVQVTATRGLRAASDVPAPVSVIDRRALDRRAPAKVGDVFALEPGVEVEGTGPFLGMPVIRGLSGNRVLVLVDGQRLNNSREAINFGGVQPSLVEVDRIQEVEILRGPASVLYGTDALGGIVNIITTRPSFASEGFDAGIRARSGYSTVDGGREVSGDAHLSGTSTSLRVAGTWREAENFNSPEGEVLNSGARSVDLGVGLTWEPADGHRFALELQRFRAKDVGVPGTTGVFTGRYPFTDRDKLALDYQTEQAGPLGSLQLEAYLQDQEESFSTVLDLPPIPAGPFRLFIDSESDRVSDVRTTGVGLKLGRALGPDALLTYGVDFFRDDVEEVRRETTTTLREPVSPGPPPNTTVSVDSFPTTPKSTFQGLGLYLQGELDVGRLSLIPGLRYDRFDIQTERLGRPEGELAARDETEDAVSASIGALFRASRQVQPTLNVGRAFRTPNIIERYFFGPSSQGGLVVPNPDLRNETSLNVDAGFRVRIGGLTGSVTYYHNRIHDFITFVPGTFNGQPTFGGQPVSQVANVGEARIRGAEAAAEYALLAGASVVALFGNVSAGDGEDLESGEPLYLPPVKGVLGVRAGHAVERTSVMLTVRMVGGQDDVPEGFDPTAGFTVVDAHGSLDLARWIRPDVVLRVGVENLLDRAYREPLSANLSPGRNLRTSLNVTF
jgi:hemoglobin/transferrin/lactoferrin receptor protein